jgi:hypothetical protein
MDKLSVLAEFEKLANREELENDEFMLFLILLAGYDCRRQCGEIRGSTVAAVLGEGFSFAAFNRACLRLSSLGLIEIVSHHPDGIAGEDSIMVYGIPRMMRVQR